MVIYSEGLQDKIKIENMIYVTQLKNRSTVSNLRNFYIIGYYNKMFVTVEESYTFVFIGL